MRKMLTLADREEISRGLAEGLELREIASLIERDPSVVSREVARHGGRTCYRAGRAEQTAVVTRRRPKVLAVDRCPATREAIVGLLAKGWSPSSVAGWLHREDATDQGHQVRHPHPGHATPSHEAIYTWVYAQPVSELARQLIVLRSGRTKRRSGRSDVSQQVRIREPRWIDDRPAEAQDRAVPGHWEGDLVIGAHGQTAVATLVERTSRFLVLVPLRGRDSLTVTDAVIAAAGGLPPGLRRSLTWDCGSEMALHAQVTTTGLPVYFAHPHSPWQRGSNENLNRIVREYFPKGTPITADPVYLAAVAAEINDRPRKIHDWKKPSEIFTELVTNASTG